jgi:2-polyprenyl-3-methyl-5-hydroxy-6-metoxy-1,4-benzoquinol methylase
MNRLEWLKEKRREAEERYGTLWAPRYAEEFGLYPNATHQTFMHKFLDLLRQPGTVLDAACGAGRYVPMLLEKGHKVLGIDQAQGMLSRAKALFPAIQIDKMGLQEMSYREVFDGVICMDAIEHVSPEDWPLVLRNLQQALKDQGYLYFTVEMGDASEIQAAFIKAQETGVPAVLGELPDEDVYHYYPPVQQVKDWIYQEEFDLLNEGEGDLYRHYIVRKSSRKTQSS